MDKKKLWPPSKNVEMQTPENRAAAVTWFTEMNKFLERNGKPPLDPGKMWTPAKNDPVLNDENFPERVKGAVNYWNSHKANKQRSNLKMKGDYGDVLLEDAKEDREPSLEERRRKMRMTP